MVAAPMWDKVRVWRRSSARALIPTSHFVFGTDYPYRTAKEHVEGLAQCGAFDAAELRAVDRDNLAALLPQYREGRAA